jgi:putative DNA primase/helicase
VLAVARPDRSAGPGLRRRETPAVSAKVLNFPTLPDAELSDRHFDDYFAPRGISRAYAAKMCVSSTADGIVFPYARPDGTWLPGFSRKRLIPAPPGRKFKQPKGTGCHLYFAPLADPKRAWADIVADVGTPLYVCESEMGAASISQLGHAAIATGGVWNWRTDGQPIDDFELVQDKGRREFLVVDADAAAKLQVQAATIGHYAERTRRGADVRVIVVPDLGDGKTGIDDYIAARGAKAFTAMTALKLDDPAFANWGLASEPGATDVGNAQRFVMQHADRVRFVHEWKAWIIWDGTRWRRDDTEAVWDFARTTIKSIYREGYECTDMSRRTAIMKWAIQSEGAARIEAMLRVSRTDRHVAVSVTQLDAHPHLLTVLNGVVDLHTSELVNADPAWLLTKQIPVAFDQRARCPRFVKFVSDVMQGDRELVAYVRRVIGYLTTGDTREQAFFIWHGVGANGKSTLLNVVAAMLGDFARSTRMETWVAQARAAGGASVAIARRHGARLVSAVESEEDHRLAESLIKELTGQDKVTARRLYEASFEYVPQFKLLIICNHKPQMRGDDAAVWRRVRLVPFLRVFQVSEQDRTLFEQLKAELPGILNWALEGCMEWQQKGLAEPRMILDAVKEYRSSSDIFELFLEECTERDPKHQDTARRLYAAYASWAKDNGHRAASSTKFSQRLQDRGFKRHRTKTGPVYLGLRVRQTTIDTMLGVPDKGARNDRF